MTHLTDKAPDFGPYYVIETDKAQEHIEQATQAISRGHTNTASAHALIALAILHCPKET